ncbi:MAG: hypothetical protein HC879_20935 [Leptolyngbyaceae cyanobacterium SL_5_9]|nr:hypothetical protein [Leptolyngbyaceae cyanobacterium SL_5_9]
MCDRHPSISIVSSGSSSNSRVEATASAKDDFLNTVSHELRTPISNMKIAIHLLKLAATPERSQQYLEILQAECAKEVNLINDLLDLQRLEAQHYPVATETIVLQSWIPDVVSPFLARSAIASSTFRSRFRLTFRQSPQTAAFWSGFWQNC